MPSSRLHKAKILDHRSAGRGYSRLVLSAPDAAKIAHPGQFVMLRVSETMEPLLARPFGIASVIARKSLEVFYRVVGRGTAQLATIKTGQSLTFVGPLGNGFPLPGKGMQPVLVAGGSGFPPLLFLAKQLGPRSRPQLFYGARDRSCLLPESVIMQFRKYGTLVRCATEDGSMGKQGIVTDVLPPLLFDVRPGERTVIYACGPRPMLAAVARVASEQSIPCYVSMEERMACGLGACMGCSVGLKTGGYKRVCKEGPVFDAREIDWREHVVLPVNSVKHQTVSAT